MNRFDETAYNLWHSNLIRGGKKSSPAMWQTEALNEKLAEGRNPQRKISLSQDQEIGMEI